MSDSPEALQRQSLREQVDSLLPSWQSWYPSLFDAAQDLGLLRARVCDLSSLMLSNRHASIYNEANAILMESVKGIQMVFVQIAGFIARRIVCYAHSGDQLEKGERIGLIRFGSRVDVYLPKNAEILVSPKDRVKAGETPLAKLPEKEN